MERYCYQCERRHEVTRAALWGGHKFKEEQFHDDMDFAQIAGVPPSLREAEPRTRPMDWWEFVDAVRAFAAETHSAVVVGSDL